MDYKDSYQMKNENKTTTTTNVGTILKLNINIDTFSTNTWPLTFCLDLVLALQ
jgi:hypothetical protein